MFCRLSVFPQPPIFIIGVPVLHPIAHRGGEPTHGVTLVLLSTTAIRHGVCPASGKIMSKVSPPFRPPLAKVIVSTDRFHGVLRHVHQRVPAVCVIIVLTRQVMTISRSVIHVIFVPHCPIKIPQIKSEYNHFILLSKKLQYTLFSLSLVVYPQILL